MDVYDYHDDPEYEPASAAKRVPFVAAMIVIALAGLALAWAAL